MTDNTINNEDYDTIAFWSFRYVLGRSTHCTTEVVDVLIKYWHLLPETTQKMIVREVKVAIAASSAGSEKYVRAWEGLLRYSVKSKAK